ncbi:hypothetical protein [Sphingomonas sp. LY160]|uniref:hypothetical protein n=1 Tax=Sphingomonas sp. LY160 TaxID=3095342 RepID=UPI002ADEDE0C|nr:hypothetical protein [Sphingomonas sp. LY160]MEA1072502.1 hypothetical protein [Sphingomonas sp. LY160]
MSPSTRFLGVVLLGWVGIRAISLGLFPAKAFAESTGLAAPSLPSIVPSQLPPIDAVAPPPMAYAAPAPVQPIIMPYPVYLPAAAPRQSAPVYRMAEAAPAPVPDYDFGNIRPIEEWPSFSAIEPTRPAAPVTGLAAMIPPATLDRLSLSSWAMMRAKPGGLGLGESGLAAGGQLGGSQAGARLLYRVTPAIAASLRASAPLGGVRGGEAALGVRVQPFASLPIAITAERRQAFGKYSVGRSAFALFAEGGLYDRPMPWDSALDAYLQTGIVGVRDRAWFVDGSAAVSRPVWRNLSAGVGMWGGAQPGLSRIDVGPRVSLKVGNKMKVHLDYRHQLAGNALPGSGAVVTLGGDF